MAVPIQSPPPPSYAEDAVRRMEAEHKLESDERISGWTVIWTLFCFKMATVVTVLVVGRNSAESGTAKSWAYIITSTWYWFIIPILAFSGIIAWHIRLRRIRRQVETLKRSEFSASAESGLESLTEEEKIKLRQIRVLAEHER